MAIGDVAGADAVDLEVDHHGLLGLGAEGAEDRLQRAYPAQAARFGRGGPPAHRLRPREVADDGRHQFGDDFFSRTARLRDMGDIEVALLRVAMDMRLGNRVQAGACAGSPGRRFGRLDARALAVLAYILGACGQAPDVERQPARRPVFARRLIGQTRLDQTVGQHLLEIARRLALHARGDFFGTQL
jgi:hypothetical protein